MSSPGDALPLILIVDDEQMITETLGLVLGHACQAEIVCTSDPQQALQILASRGVTLLITDYYMPGTNGLQLIEKTRAMGKDLPVLMLTGYYDSPELDPAHLDLGTFEIMAKPWDQQRLIQRARSYIGEL